MKKIKKNKIKNFEIQGLFYEYNLVIDFKNSINILIGENGIGKTTILNIFNYMINEQYQKLLNYKFNSCIVMWENGEKLIFEFDKKNKDLAFISRIMQHGRIFTNFVTKDDIRKNHMKNYDTEVINLANEKIENLNIINENNEKIEKSEILYFPTYRRVEESLIQLLDKSDNMYNIIQNNKSIIKFGMNDVKKQFEDMLYNIKSISLDAYSKVASDMITNLLNDKEELSKEVKENLTDKKTVDVVLSRLQNTNLSENDKKKINQIINNKNIINDNSYYQLALFLSKLMEVYNDKLKNIDESIKKFVEVVNQYFVNKYIEYDEKI